MDGPISRREVWFWRKNPIGAKVMNQHLNFPFDRFDALDAAHDLWVGTMAPPREMEPDKPWIHKEFRKLLRNSMFKGEKPVLADTHGSVQLASWR